jgi:hypothetical protein
VHQVRRQRIHLLWIIPLLLVVAVGVTGVAMLFQWLRSEECLLLIQEKTSGALHASAKLAPLHWGWLGVSSSSLEVSGSENSSLKQLNSDGLRARLRPAALMQGYWLIEEISLEKLTLHLGRPGSEAVINEVVAASPSPLPKWLPSQLVIEVIRTDHADMIIEIPHGGVMKILGSHLEAYPETHPKGDETRFEARGGEYSFARFPDLKLNLRTLRARISQSGTELTGAELSPSAGGTIKLEGSFPTGGQTKRLSGHWEKIPLTALLPALKGHIVGTLEGNGHAEWGSEGFLVAEGTVSASDVTLTQIPVLKTIAALTGIAAFNNLPVQLAHASYSRRGEATDWNEVVLESRGLVKFVGNATTKSDGSLSGIFQLGITSSIVAILPFAKEILGLNEHDGFIWMPVQIGGSLSHPTEDLSPRLGMAITAGATGVARESIQAGLKILGLDQANSTNSSTNSSLPIPTDAVKTLEQGVGKGLDALGGFLK